MKFSIIFIALLLISAQAVRCQIFEEDSTVKVIAYWDLNESYTYSVLFEQFELVGEDTVDRTTTTYLIDAIVIDSTSNSYKMRWTYRDLKVEMPDKDSTYSDLMNKLMGLSGGAVVEFETDELGGFQGVTNWETIRDYYKVASDSMKSYFGQIPQVNDFIDRMMIGFMTKESIESSSIKDVHQFLNFHSAELQLGRPEFSTMKFPDATGTELMDALVSIEVTGIFPEDDDYAVYSKVDVNPDQLKSVARKNVRNLLPNASEEELDQVFEQMGEIWTEIENFAVIHYWGWPRYTKEVRRAGSALKNKVEIRTIEII